jgi:hypothetical protein
MKAEAKDFYNFGYIIADVPKDLYKLLIEESKIAEKENKEMHSGITGKRVAKQYFIKNSLIELNNFIEDLRKEYDNKYPGLSNLRVLTKNAPYFFTTPWINFQKKHEFIPNHRHDGVYSYSMWLKIPYEYEEETKGGGIHASVFEFTYIDVNGYIQSNIIKLGSNFERKVIMFPSKMLHCVYPFYTSDETRLSVSGNILLNNG